MVKSSKYIGPEGVLSNCFQHLVSLFFFFPLFCPAIAMGKFFQYQCMHPMEPAIPMKPYYAFSVNSSLNSDGDGSKYSEKTIITASKKCWTQLLMVLSDISKFSSTESNDVA